MSKLIAKIYLHPDECKTATESTFVISQIEFDSMETMFEIAERIIKAVVKYPDEPSVEQGNLSLG
jgi:hypothetical protein